MVTETDRQNPKLNGAKMPDDDKKSVTGRLKGLLPGQSTIPKLTAEAWKAVILKVIERLPPKGLAVIIWTAVVLLGVWLIMREMN